MVLVSAAVPEGHLLQHKLNLFLKFIIILTSSQCDSMLVALNADLKNMSLNQPVHVENIMHIHEYTVYIDCTCMH